MAKLYLSLVEAVTNVAVAVDGDVLVRSKPYSVLFIERPMLPKYCHKEECTMNTSAGKIINSSTLVYYSILSRRNFNSK